MYVCTQVDALQEIAVAAEAVVKSEVGEAAAAIDPENDAKENPPKRVKLEIVPEVASKSTTYRAMCYKSGLCLKSCAYICEYNINMNRNRHTHTHTRHYNHTRGNRVGIREINGLKKQIVQVSGKDKLCKGELLIIANRVIEELDAKTLSLVNLADRVKKLISTFPEAEDIF